MKNDWFTADTHFGHERIIINSKRPFASAEEMDETMIDNWNKVVQPHDDVWHLGDFSFRSVKLPEVYVARLNGRIHMIWGNHDDREAKRAWKQSLAEGGRPLFESAQEIKYLKVNGESITLYHYAQRVWRNSHRGAWHLYGHSHGSLPNFHRSLDVGVDCHGFAPIHFDQIKPYMDRQPVTDHHPELLTDPWVKDDDQ